MEVIVSKQEVNVTMGTGLIVIVIEFEVAGFPCGQETFDVKMQLTTSPLAGERIYEVELPPTFDPFSFHW